ncbi:MAG: anaerobic ribonucleoside-triphosphate reductase [Lachnospiraceae bacterium]|nr:anaerobic ribonucleoside-triphosphate reductase [Lachnospiraceae bacterium]
MKILKSGGIEATFNKSNIVNAIQQANQRVGLDNRFTNEEIKEIAKNIETLCKNEQRTLNTGDIQKMVEDEIMNRGKFDIAREYITYRYQKELNQRKNTTDDDAISLLNNSNEILKQENANKNPTILSTQRDYLAGLLCKDLSKRYLIPADILKCHDEKIIHWHDMDYSFQKSTNCCLWNLDDMLQNGTVISGIKIDKPHKFSTACNICSQIIAQIASSQYGGQTVNIAHLAPFVEESRKTFRSRFENLNLPEDKFNELIEQMVERDIVDGVQILQYQISTLMTVNGQTPFVTLWMYLNDAKDEKEKEDLAKIIAEIIKQRKKGVKNKNGAYSAIPFPKLIYALEEDNINEDGKYYWLTKLSAECTADKMVPDYISEKMMLELKGLCYPSMGCRSFGIVRYYDKNGKQTMNKKKGTPKVWPTFNQGVVTINLPDVAFSSKGDMERFWYIFNERLEICHRALRLRHEYLRGTPAQVNPIMWQHGGIARLDDNETIDKLLYNDNSSLSLGYIGLYECVKYMTGKDHWLPESEGGALEFAIEIMENMRNKCSAWRETEGNLGYSLYSTPEENLTGTAADALKRRFPKESCGLVGSFVTNSYHIPVYVDINAFDKIKYEAPLAKLASGGQISYIEMDDLRSNVDVVLDILRYAYDKIIYFELNGKSDYCLNCNYDGTIELIQDEDGKYIWRCPNCGCTDRTKLLPTRRICGYLGQANDCSQGRLADIFNRVTHV